MKMKKILNYTFIFSILFFIFLTVYSESKEEIFHISKEVLLNRSESNLEVKEFITREGIRDWKCEFICWEDCYIINPGDLSKKVEIPGGVLKFMINLAKKESNSKLLTKTQMSFFALNLLAKNYYYIYRRLERKCSLKKGEITDLFIFDMRKSEEIALFYQKSNTNIRKLTQATNGFSDKGTISILKDLFTEENFANFFGKTTLQFEIHFLKCDFDQSNMQFTQNKLIIDNIFNNSKHYESTNSFNISGRELTIDFEYSKGTPHYLKKLNEKCLWFGSDKELIYHNSLFQYLINANMRIKGEIFKLFFAHTRNFSPNIASIPKELKKDSYEYQIIKNDIPMIRDFIKKITASGEKVSKIELIGYADSTGKEKLGSEWEKNNGIISLLRAKAIEQILKKELKQIDDTIALESKGCDTNFFTKDKRHVEINIY